MILLSILAFSLVGRQAPLVMIASRILLIPVIAAVGYELLRLGAQHRSNPIVKVIMWPGILVQMITTKQPTDDMIEVAIVSLEQTIARRRRPHPGGRPGPAARPDAAPRRDREGRARRAGGGRRRGGGAGLDRPARRGLTPRPARPPAMTDSGGLDAKLADLARQYDEVGRLLGTPDVLSDPDQLRKLGRELSRLEPVVAAYRELVEVREQLAGARELREEADEDMRAMVREEITDARGARDGPRRRPPGLAHPARPQRRPQRHRRDPGRRRRRGGGAVRERAAAHVHALRAGAPVRAPT